MACCAPTTTCTDVELCREENIPRLAIYDPVCLCQFEDMKDLRFYCTDYAENCENRHVEFLRCLCSRHKHKLSFEALLIEANKGQTTPRRICELQAFVVSLGINKGRSDVITYALCDMKYPFNFNETFHKILSFHQQKQTAEFGDWGLMMRSIVQCEDLPKFINDDPKQCWCLPAASEIMMSCNCPGHLSFSTGYVPASISLCELCGSLNRHSMSISTLIRQANLGNQCCFFQKIVVATAAFHGRKDIISYLRQRSITYAWDEQACAMAARQNNLDLLVWLRENGCPWNKETTKQSAKYLAKLNEITDPERQERNCFKVLRFALTNGCEIDPVVIGVAFDTVNWPLMKFALYNQAPKGHISDMYEAMLHFLLNGALDRVADYFLCQPKNAVKAAIDIIETMAPHVKAQYCSGKLSAWRQHHLYQVIMFRDNLEAGDEEELRSILIATAYKAGLLTFDCPADPVHPDRVKNCPPSPFAKSCTPDILQCGLGTPSESVPRNPWSIPLMNFLGKHNLFKCNVKWMFQYQSFLKNYYSGGAGELKNLQLCKMLSGCGPNSKTINKIMSQKNLKADNVKFEDEKKEENVKQEQEQVS